MADDFIIFAGTANRTLAEKIAFEVGVELGNCLIERFPDGELSVRLCRTVRGRSASRRSLRLTFTLRRSK